MGFKYSAFGLGSWHGEGSSGGEPEDGNNRDLHCGWMSGLSSFEINVEAEMRQKIAGAIKSVEYCVSIGKNYHKGEVTAIYLCIIII